jgi:flavin reductase (DIM6/NTAB) family NADH-FMN oxidoreductase RutF
LNEKQGDNAMNKVMVSPETATKLINHGPVVIVSVGDTSKDNLFAVAWNMPIRKVPPMVAIESGKAHYSYDFIVKTGEFGINVPSARIAEKVFRAGTISGAATDDKWRDVGLTRQAPSAIKPPLVAEAVANLECRVCQVVDLGASSLLIAQVVAAAADETVFDGNTWRFDTGLELLHHIGGNKFSVATKLIEIPLK